MRKLENKVAVVTGGAMGNGLGICRVFLKYGAKLIILDYSDELEGSIGILNEEFPDADILGYKVDIRNKDIVKEAIDNAYNAFGKIDVLVNNAGITKDGLIAMMKEEAFDKVIDINLKGTFNVVRNVVPFMIKKRNGCIVNISSVVGVCGNAGQSNYSASKAGIIGFTKSLAKELAARNIRVNAVAPGFIDTDMTSVLKDQVKDSINAQIPLKRMGEAKEVANVVYFLSSDESSYITGQVINVDGGMVM